MAGEFMPERRRVTALALLLLTPASLLALASRQPAQGQMAQATTHRIEIKDFVFEPATLSAKPGDRIEWTNQDLAPHTATADDDSWDSGELAKGQSWTLEVTEANTGRYYCRFHPQMAAEIQII